MDYAEMVSQIMAAEQGAKVLAEESRARRQQLQAGLDEEISAMRESYLARARQRLEQVQQTEEAAAEEALTGWTESWSRPCARWRRPMRKTRSAGWTPCSP